MSANETLGVRRFAADSQIPVVNAVTAIKPDVAAIVPTDTQALVAPMEQLAAMGTKVITVDQIIVTVASAPRFHRISVHAQFSSFEI